MDKAGCLLDVDLFCAFLHLFLLRQQKFQDAIFIFGLDPVGVDLVIEVEATLEAAERKLLADRLILFGTGFFFLFEADRQLTIVERQLEVFFATAGGAQFKVKSVSGFVDIDRRKAKAFVLNRKTLEDLINELGKAPVSVVVYFYECHTIDYLCLNFVLRGARIKRHTSGQNRPGSGRTGAVGPIMVTEGHVLSRSDDNISVD